MRAKRRTPEEQAGGRIAGLAVAQHGVASRPQLRELGLSELQAVAHAHRGHHGAARLATVPASHQVGSTLTRSELEETFLAICRSHNLPRPQLNVRIARYTVDFLWAHEMLIVETDGYETHRFRGAFESDRERLTVLGYRTLRFTYRQVEGQPLVVANLVRSALRGP
jgi:very-short-patch-repair endonuclease